MATFNNYPVTARFNRPSPTNKTLLEFFYIKNGTFTNPTNIESVHIFPDTNQGSPDNWLDLSAGSGSYGLVASSLNSSAPVIFKGEVIEGDYLNTATNSIFVRDTGKFAVVLEDGIEWILPNDSSEQTYAADSMAAQKYWDIWTVVDGDTSSVYVHSFELFNDNIISLTEPLMVTTSQRLVQKYINKNSKTDLHVTSSHTVNNSNITPEVKNIFNNTILNNAAIRIIKLKDDTSTGAPYEEVLAWTSTGVTVNSDDTIIYNWDTATQAVGTYELQVSSTFLNQNVMSDKFNLVVR